MAVPIHMPLLRAVATRALREAYGVRAHPPWLRRVVAISVLIGWAALGALHRACLHLDDLLFPGYRKVALRDPLFVVGVPRSGTTYLHRFLAEESESFTTMKTWEVLLAPSIVQKRALLAIGRIDRFLGSPLMRAYRWSRERSSDRLRGIHEVGLFLPEEDEYLLGWGFATLFLSDLIPYWDLIGPLADFDRALTDDRRQALMEFHVACLKRHAYVFGNGRRLLSKNPAMAGKLASLKQALPDAQLVMTVRNPLDTVPSYLSFLRAVQDGLSGASWEDRQRTEGAVETLAKLTRAGLENGPQLFPGRFHILPYADLTRRFSTTVRRCYEQLGIPLTPSSETRIQEEEERSAQYTSRHRYSLSEFGWTSEEIQRRFAPIYEAAGLDPQV